MNTGQYSVSPVEVLAALGEPHRWSIARSLVMQDRSLRDLGDAAGCRTSLLTHHVDILSRARVLRRQPSEGDKRRSYVSLCINEPTVTAVLGVLTPRPAVDPARMVFVCTENSARSQIAAAIWNETSRIPAVCAGTRPVAHVHPRALAAGRRRGVPMVHTRPRHLSEIRQDGDYIVTVCDRAYESLDSEADAHWSIPDPAQVGTPAAFDRAYDLLQRRTQWVGGLLENSGRRRHHTRDRRRE